MTPHHRDPVMTAHLAGGEVGLAKTVYERFDHIPGTGSVAHLRENLAAEGVTLDGQALRELDGVAG
ncbi:MAG: hypothetical protein ACRDOD_20730 [Streptosporangiaceae bacterium]